MQPQIPVKFNGYLVFILSLMAAGFLIDLVANALNASHLSAELPREFDGIYDPVKYRTSIEYERESFRFDALQKAFWLVATVIFIVAGGFNAVDRFARGFGLGEIVTGLVFVAALSVLRFGVGLPFSIYDTFVLEARYGFNRTTAGTFVADIFKGAALAALLGSPIFAAVVWFFGAAGSWGWLYSWAVFALVQLLIIFLAPAVIMPLFNKFEPLPDGALKEAIERFAALQGFALQGDLQDRQLQRSTKSNAFFAGFGRFRRLVLFDTLIEKHSCDELVAVIAHEIGHFKRKHIQKSILLSTATSAAMFFVLGLFMKNEGLFRAFGMQNVSVYASLVFVGFLFSPVTRFLSIFTHLLSRKHEFEADRYAVETYGKPEELISALKKLSIDNLSNLTPHPLKVILDYTHPPILRRIEALRALNAAGNATAARG